VLTRYVIDVVIKDLGTPPSIPISFYRDNPFKPTEEETQGNAY